MIGAAEKDAKKYPDEKICIYSFQTDSGKEWIKFRDIEGYLKSELFLQGLQEWRRFKRFGLPHGQGWANERPRYVRVVEIFEQEYDLYQSEEMKSHGKR